MPLTNANVETYGTLAGIFLVAILQQYNSWRTKQRDADVKDVLKDSQEKRDAALLNIHALVNGTMASKLQKIAEVTAKLADITKDPVTAIQAKLAQDDYESHVEKQAAVHQALIDAVQKAPDAPTVVPITNKNTAL